ncbi:hypothetical protein C0J52_02206 [Blattella germanica]|nr:hypothetical protein C0J52_02206 [Blattella germanica]
MALSSTYLVIAFLCAGVSSFSVGPQDMDLNLRHEAVQQVMSLIGAARHRVTREVDIVHPPKCCGKENIVISDDDKKMMDECDPHGKENGGMTACWMECMAKKKATLDAAGNVDVAAFTKVYLTHYVDESLKPKTEDAIKTCAEMMNKKASEMGPEEYKGNKCNRAALLTSFCVRYIMETVSYDSLIQ